MKKNEKYAVRKLSCFFFRHFALKYKNAGSRVRSAWRFVLPPVTPLFWGFREECGCWERVRERERGMDAEMVVRWGEWESLKSFTMDCDGPGWRFIGDSPDVRRRNQVSAGLRSRLETVSAARPAPFILLFLRGRRKKKEQSGKYHHLYSCWIFPSSFRTETSLEMNGGQTYYDRRLKTRTSN